jgi:transcription elongation factor
MPYLDPRDAVPSAARTTNGNSGQLTPAGDGETLALHVSITAASGGTPSLALSVEWSNDGSNWATPDGTADTFTAFTATAQKVKTFERKAKFYRIVWAITGTTPSFTFSIMEFIQQ